MPQFHPPSHISVLGPSSKLSTMPNRKPIGFWLPTATHARSSVLGGPLSQTDPLPLGLSRVVVQAGPRTRRTWAIAMSFECVIARNEPVAPIDAKRSAAP